MNPKTQIPVKPTIEYIREKFGEFNRQMFGGRLPELPIVLADAKGYLGQVVSRGERLPDGRVRKSDWEMRINTRVDLPEQEVEDTIIHEMIHYFIDWNGLQDKSSHGPLFIALMNSINDTFGRSLSISHQSTEEEQRQAVSSRRTWHVVAVAVMTDGDCGVKVLPRNPSTVLKFYDAMKTAQGVGDLNLYLTDDPFFNRFPTSGATRLHPVGLQEVVAHLHGSQRLRVNGSQIVPSEKIP